MRFTPIILALAAALTGVVLLISVGEGTAGPQTVWTSQDGNVRVLFILDKLRYVRGEAVTLRLTVANLGQTPLSYHFRSGKHYDFEIYHGGTLIWRWSEGKVFVQMLTTFQVPPGERKDFVEQWRQMDLRGGYVPPGEYTAVAFLPVDREAGGAAAPDRLVLHFSILP